MWAQNFKKIKSAITTGLIPLMIQIVGVVADSHTRSDSLTILPTLSIVKYVLQGDPLVSGRNDDDVKVEDKRLDGIFGISGITGTVLAKQLV